MKEVYLKVPELPDLWFRKKCMEDPNTMSYNAGYDVSYEGYHYDTGCIDFPESKWQKWYDTKLKKDGLYYAYIVDKDTNEFVGYINYHKNQNGTYSMGVLIHAGSRGKGYMKPALRELIKVAKESGINELWDCVPLNREHALKGFTDVGFEIVSYVDSVRFNKVDKCANIRYKI